MAWVASVRSPALAAARDPANAGWLRHQRTWFVGVDALANDARGRVAGGTALDGAAIDAAQTVYPCDLHRAQVSVTYPGYPLQDADESAAAHRFRRDRDAAHLDGLLPLGPEKRRHLVEPHAWILGVALTEADAAPLVVWEGSQDVIRRAFTQAFTGVAPADWAQVDVTNIYKAARAEVFAKCPRVEVPLAVGEAVLVHRMAIHGVAPWAEGASADPAGRAIAYFRPCVQDPAEWLALP